MFGVKESSCVHLRSNAFSVLFSARTAIIMPLCILYKTLHIIFFVIILGYNNKYNNLV